MKIVNNRVVSLHYTLTNEEGQILDSSQGLEPLHYLHGHKNIILGLEKGLEGAQLGQDLQLEISPEEGYGLYYPHLVQEIPLENLQHLGELTVGNLLEVATETGPQIVTLLKLSDTTATLDANHPLAGEKLFFKLNVISIREATSEEIHQGLVILPS